MKEESLVPEKWYPEWNSERLPAALRRALWSGREILADTWEVYWELNRTHRRIAVNDVKEVGFEDRSEPATQWDSKGNPLYPMVATINEVGETYPWSYDHPLKHEVCLSYVRLLPKFRRDWGEVMLRECDEQYELMPPKYVGKPIRKKGDKTKWAKDGHEEQKSLI